MHDIIVAGGGPAGMTAAIYALRNGKGVLVVERDGFGGQMANSPKIENFPGTRQVAGAELADRMMDQMLALGADIEIGAVTGVSAGEGRLAVTTDEGESFDAGAVILATGVRHRMLGLPGEEGLVGDGVSFCAVCDGDFYAGQTVCVAGGGNSALQEAILLAGKCERVVVLQDLPHLTGEQRLQDVLLSRPNVEVHVSQAVTGLLGGPGGLRAVEVADRVTGARREVACTGLFEAVGLIPENDAFRGVATLDAQGYFDADERCLTRTPGVFVAGDCRRKAVRQVTTAAADGAVAALAACRYLDGLEA